MKQKLTPQKGMTLLEVMIAVAILATVAGVVALGVSGQMHGFSAQKLGVIASWVAQNRMNETLLQADLPRVGTTRGEVENGDMTWYWEQRVTNNNYQGIKIRRVEIDIKLDETSEDSYAFLTALVGEKRR